MSFETPVLRDAGALAPFYPRISVLLSLRLRCGGPSSHVVVAAWLLLAPGNISPCSWQPLPTFRNRSTDLRSELQLLYCLFLVQDVLLLLLSHNISYRVSLLIFRLLFLLV